MIVCVCKRVSDREIARHALAGMDFNDIQLKLGVATQCGRCEDCARGVVAQHRQAVQHDLHHHTALPVLGHRVFPILSAAA